MSDMRIFPKCRQLQISMYSCLAFGCFPWEMTFKENKTYQTVYALYGKIMLTCYFWIIFSIYVQLALALKADLNNMDVISGIISVALINTATVFRLIVMIFHSDFTKLVQSVVDFEKIIYSIRLPEVVEAYNVFIENYNKNCKLYLYFMIFLALNFFIRPILVQPDETYVGNSTILTRSIPMPCWLPFDKQEYYAVAYTLASVYAVIGASYVAISDVFMCTLIAHPMGLLTVLRYILINFEKQAELCHSHSRSMTEYYTFISVIEWHNKIIQFVSEYNRIMSTVMLFDFLQSSVQVAFIVVQVLQSGLTPMIFSYVVSFVLTMLCRLVLYYYYANEVTILSENVAYEIWDTRWIERHPRIKLMMRIFIMRCQKSLTYNIGSFGTLSMAALLSLLRTTYSYIMLFNGFSNE